MTQLAPEQAIAASTPLTAASLEQLLRSVQPNVVLAPLWLLQNLVDHERGTGGSAFTVPHRRILVIERDRLKREASDADLPLPADLPDTPTLILLARPDGEWLAQTPDAEALRYYWRLLFHARVDMELHAILLAPAVGNAGVERRIERIGRAAFNEAKFVLQRERYLPHVATELEAYAEFAAVFFELHYFRPDLLATYFPAIDDTASVIAALADDIQAEELLGQTRPPGAAEAIYIPPEPDTLADPTEEAAARQDLIQLAIQDLPRVPRLLARAKKAAAAGNASRSAILRMRVFRAVRDPDAMQESMQDLEGLVQRLRAALAFDDAATNAWGSALIPLLAHAAGGWWNPEGRLLYELQKVCIAHEREIYSVGVVEWLLEFCRRPLRRPQPNQRQVLICKALRSAIGRLPKTRLTGAQRVALDSLLHAALHQVEHRLRDSLRPAVIESLKAGGVHPHTKVERVAEIKLVEELLDGLLHRGFITMGNVRDAISRNQMKFHDLRGPRTWFRGQLLRVDRGLGDSLDGVYHRGEIYLRFFQRLSSLLFATKVGRFITKTVIMPILGSYLILEALDHTIFLILRLLTGWKGLTLSHFEDMKGKSFEHFLSENIPFVLLVFTLLGALNWPRFRTAVGHGLRAIGRLLRAVLYDYPQWLLQWPPVKAILESRAFRLAGRYVFKPLAVAAVVWVFVPRTVRPRTRGEVLAGVFVATNLLLNSRTGRALEQATLHWLRVTWTRVTGDILGNLFRGIIHFFERMLEDLDRMLYAVDEWLRFRAGQNRASLIFKASLGIIWFYIAYFVRFAINLLIEPQINPIKHFPVVTVSHKIVLPTVGLFAKGYEGLGLPAMRAGTAAGLTVTVIPGIFGFLAWELKENWKLYRANRAKVLKPVAVGSHGESMARLLRPGFHSGTVPKIFAKLRRARRRAERPGMAERARAAAHKQLEHADHVREDVAHFIHREWAALLNQHPAWQATPVSLGELKLSASRIAVELRCCGVEGGSAVVSFEQRAGWILAGVDRAGWMANLPPEQKQLLSVAMLGLYKITGVDLVKEQIEAIFGPQPVAFELAPQQLTVWPGKTFDVQWVYALSDDGANSVSIDPNAPRVGLSDLLLKSTAIPWGQWVRVWDSSAETQSEAAISAFRVLPS